MQIPNDQAIDIIIRILSPVTVIAIFVISYDYLFRKALKNNKDALRIVIDELYANTWRQQTDDFHAMLQEQNQITEKLADNLHKLEVIVARIDERKFTREIRD
jgi:hypothetical protein